MAVFFLQARQSPKRERKRNREFSLLHALFQIAVSNSIFELIAFILIQEVDIFK